MNGAPDFAAALRAATKSAPPFTGIAGRFAIIDTALRSPVAGFRQQKETET